MALYYPGCETNIPVPVCSDCPTKESAGIRSIFLVKKSFAFTDITDVAEWTTGINAGDIYVFPYTRGTMTPTPNMQPGYGDNEETLDSYTFDLNIMEPNYKANYGFWNAIKNNKNFKAGYRTETQVHLFTNTANIIPSAPVGEDKKQAVVWDIKIKVTQEDLPEPLDMPVGVFERCIQQ